VRAHAVTTRVPLLDPFPYLSLASGVRKPTRCGVSSVTARSDDSVVAGSSSSSSNSGSGGISAAMMERRVFSVFSVFSDVAGMGDGSSARGPAAVFLSFCQQRARGKAGKRAS
jgi:hypothetical protein